MNKKVLTIIVIVITMIFSVTAAVVVLGSASKKQEEKKELERFVDVFEDYSNTEPYNLQEKYKGTYKNLYNVDENYTIDKAIEDKCYVKVHSDIYNEDIFIEFINKYNNKQSAFLRKVLVTIEGDIIIEDYVYDSGEDKAYKFIDVTRDKFMSDEQREITYSVYDSPYSNEEWKNIITDLK